MTSSMTLVATILPGMRLSKISLATFDVRYATMNTASSALPSSLHRLAQVVVLAIMLGLCRIQIVTAANKGAAAASQRHHVVASSWSMCRARRHLVSKSTRPLFEQQAKHQQAAKQAHGVASSVKGGAQPPKIAYVAERSALEAALAFPKENPFMFQLIVATCKTAAADIMIQTVADGKSFTEIDWRRNAIFVVFGFAYLGGFQWYLMVNKYRQWFPTMDRFAKMSVAEKLKDTAGILDAGKMVLFDIFVHLPFLYFPTYYCVKEFVGGNSWHPADWVRDGLTKYRGNFWSDFDALVKLWGPSDTIQFVLPLYMRMPFRHFVSFFWTAYVSFTRGKIETPTTAESIGAPK